MFEEWLLAKPFLLASEALVYYIKQHSLLLSHLGNSYLGRYAAIPCNSLNQYYYLYLTTVEISSNELTLWNVV